SAGGAITGAGSITGHRRIESRELLPYGKFHLEGANLRVADIPEAQIDASPDLDFSVAGRRIEVSGKVTVPFAKIQPRNLADAVRASPDEVIVGSEVEDPAKRFEAMSAITLVLGDKVNIDTSGLTGRGTLLQPHMPFSSDPPLPQSQVVSLILAGGSLESAQTRTTGNSGAGGVGGPGSGAGGAALAQGAAILGQQLGSHVGIE